MSISRIGNIDISTASHTLAQTYEANPSFTVVFTQDSASASRLKHELMFFLPDEQIDTFPDWETLPYDQFSPHQDIISERLRLLHALPNRKRGILISPIETAAHHFPPQTFLAGNVFCLEIGTQINLNTYPQQLSESGYTRVNQVLSKGEFALRGSIIDLFPMGATTPLRLELFDDEIATIRTFDIDTQRSIDQIERIEILPACEYPLTPGAIDQFTKNWEIHFKDNTFKSHLLEAIQAKRSAGGIEYYLPLFFDKTAYFFDYFPSKTRVTHVFNTQDQLTEFWSEIQERYAIYQYDLDRPALDPLTAFYHPTQVMSKAQTFPTLKLVQKSLNKSPNQYSISTQAIPDFTFTHAKTFERFAEWLSDTDRRILISVESAGRREMMLEHLSRVGLKPRVVNAWPDFQDTDAKLCITISRLQDSLYIEGQSWVLLTEKSLFSHFVPQARRAKSDTHDTGIVVKDLAELKIGDAVVHISHGIGRYLGLEKISLGSQAAECIAIEYHGGDKLFVPVGDLQDVTRYSGADMQFAPISRLGSGKWEKDKEKAAKRIRDVAAELLAIYAKRDAKSGFSYDRPDDDFAKFSAGFPFEETPDQLKAIAAVIDDMHAPKPMDRLLCGDVGFGKTEVAMRAAFLAVHQKKQVAILVPTTLLAQQHYENFVDRFADWPVSIELLSRFRSAAQQKDIMQKLSDNRVDIIIGTHKLLSKDIRFKNLGLLIVDEEHRFGVRHKEKIKAMRTDVDILTMTATPIPRTLNMAFASLRDLSLIATPPAKRLSVKTFVKPYEHAIIKEAITREVHRGGQVYFLFNDVARIEAQKAELQTLLPNISIGIGHGQMRERELERVMSDFYHNHHQVLLCTTIIETGIDIPNANTIIIDRADKFGLAQLHQLRGRVGRSHHQAYAYLLTPPKEALSEDAKRRLDAIEGASHLGSGFTLASHDLDIRGAGELLGDEQSGNMEKIGFSLYMELLERTVKALKAGKSFDVETLLDNTQVEVELGISAIIPDTYVPDVSMRLSLYKRISDAQTLKALDELKVEIIDRFGLLPDQVSALFAVSDLKLKAKAINLTRISASQHYINFEFSQQHTIRPEVIIKLIQKNPSTYKLKGETTLAVAANHTDDTQKIALCNTVMQKIGGTKI